MELEERRVRVYPPGGGHDSGGARPPVLESLVGVDWPEGLPNRKEEDVHIEALPCFNPRDRTVRVRLHYCR